MSFLVKLSFTNQWATLFLAPPVCIGSARLVPGQEEQSNIGLKQSPPYKVSDLSIARLTWWWK